MSDAFVGEIRLFPFEWAPEGWLPCDGREVQVWDYSVLYALIRNRYGGDGRTKFNLPDLRGRTIYGAQSLGGSEPAPGYAGYSFGEETVTLSQLHMPPHSHPVKASSKDGDSVPMAGAGLGKAVPAQPSVFPPGAEIKVYDVSGPAFTHAASLHAETVSATGGSGAHQNMQPFLAVQYCICVRGEFPSRG